MIKHIVCFKLKDNSLEECEKAANILKSMEGNVPLLRGIEPLSAPLSRLFTSLPVRATEP